MKQHLRPIMFVGTCSDAGKSVINAAFCRIFKQDGYQPAPFKAQNMSLNSYSTPEGGESRGLGDVYKRQPQFLLYPGRRRDGPGASRTSGGLRYFPAYGYEPDITKADK